MGVTRHMRGDEAKQQCPDIELCRVPSVRGKADISKFRNAGREVIAVLSEFSNVVERASIDEAYIDLTDVVQDRMESIGQISVDQLANTFVVGFGPNNNDEDARKSGLSEWLDQIYNGEDTSLMDNTEDFLELAVAGVIVEEIRAAVLSKTQFHCSAGIAHNKCLAKLVCGLHKPQKQSILPHSSVSVLYSSLPVQKVRHLGGKLGYEVMEKLGINTMIELEKFSLKQLQGYFDEKTGTWLFNIARGLDNEPVNARLVAKSIGCCKRFPGKTCLATRQDVAHWIHELVDEMCERLEDDLTLNKRRAQLLTVSFAQEVSGKVSSFSRSTSLPNYKLHDVVEVSMQVIKKTNSAPVNEDVWSPPLFFLGLSASKFSPLTSQQSIQQFFKPQDYLESRNELLTPFEHNAQRNNDRKLTDGILKCTNTSRFQWELKNIEKRLIDEFKGQIDLKLVNCSSKHVDKIILEDIAQQIKNIAIEKLRLYLKSFYSEGEQDNFDCMKERITSIEEEVVKKVNADIKESFMDINDILFVEIDQDLLKDNANFRENEKVSTCSIRMDSRNQCETFINSEQDSDSAIINTAAANTLISPCSSRSQVSTSLITSSKTQTDFTKEIGVSPVLFENPIDTFSIANSTSTSISKHTAVVTYTRRQVNPERISDSNSLDQTDEISSQPVVITKPVVAFNFRKYEHVKSNKSTSVEDSAGSYNTKSSNQPTSSKKTGKYSNSFFNKFLQKKKESEKSNFTLCKDEDRECTENIPGKETNESKLEESSLINEANDMINFQTKNSTPVKDYKMNKSDDENKIENFASSSSVTAGLIDSSDGKKSMDPESGLKCGDYRFHNLDANEINSDANNPYKYNDYLKNIKSETAVSVDISNRELGIDSSLDEPKFNSEALAQETSTHWSTNSKNVETKITCDKCNKHIAEDALQEHQDYHFALELSTSAESESLAGSSFNTSSSSSTKVFIKKSNKRGRPSKMSVLQNSVNVKKLKTIDEFFKPKQPL
ncbi:hypothetical protein WDU94_008352 [Cyamophila willieti]